MIRRCRYNKTLCTCITCRPLTCISLSPVSIGRGRSFVSALIWYLWHSRQIYVIGLNRNRTPGHRRPGAFLGIHKTCGKLETTPKRVWGRKLSPSRVQRRRLDKGHGDKYWRNGSICDQATEITVCWSSSQVLVFCKRVSWSGRLSHDTPAVTGDAHCWIFAEEEDTRLFRNEGANFINWLEALSITSLISHREPVWDPWQRALDPWKLSLPLPRV